MSPRASSASSATLPVGALWWRLLHVEAVLVVTQIAASMWTTRHWWPRCKLRQPPDVHLWPRVHPLAVRARGGPTHAAQAAAACAHEHGSQSSARAGFVPFSWLVARSGCRLAPGLPHDGDSRAQSACSSWRAHGSSTIAVGGRAVSGRYRLTSQPPRTAAHPSLSLMPRVPTGWRSPFFTHPQRL